MDIRDVRRWASCSPPRCALYRESAGELHDLVDGTESPEETNISGTGRAAHRQRGRGDSLHHWLESEQLRRWGFRSRVAIIPNAIEAATFQEMPERGALRAKLAIPASATVSLYVGRLHKMKRIDLLVEGFARVARDTGNAHLVVVGPDEDGTGLSAQARVAELGLSAQVHFLGLLTGHDLLQAYRDADLLTLLSHRENFGMAAVEAMAAGLPVLLTQEVGLAEEIARARAGYAVQAQPDQVAEMWVRMLNAPELRHEMGLSGKAIVRQKFELSMVASQMLKLFTDSVGGD